MQCPTCGSSVVAGDVCPECGMDLTAAPSPPSPSQLSPSKVESAAYHTVALDAKTDAVEFASESTPSTSAARLTLQRNGAPTSHIFPIGERVTLGRFDPSAARWTWI